VRFGLAARGVATAAMDLSDGLVADLPKLAQASGLAAHVAVERLPLSEANARRRTGTQSARLRTGGGRRLRIAARRARAAATRNSRPKRAN